MPQNEGAGDEVAEITPYALNIPPVYHVLAFFAHPRLTPLLPIP